MWPAIAIIQNEVYKIEISLSIESIFTSGAQLFRAIYPLSHNSFFQDCLAHQTHYHVIWH